MYSDESYAISRRKTEGIYYTPDFVTEYICRNTIIPFLSDRGTNDITLLVKEYQNNIKILVDKLKEITILDPACGSGVFLLKAIEILMDVKKKIVDFKKSQGENLTFDATKEIKEIIRNNIFGVDLDEEAVKVARLSILQRSGLGSEELCNQLEKIRLGNALIDDQTIAGDNAFDWERELLATLPHRKFDVIVGNPPWGAVFKRKELDFLKNRYREVSTRTVNSFKMFVQRALELLNLQGAFGFILPSSLIEMPDYADLRKLLLKYSKSLKIIDLGDDIFPKVNTPSCIITFPHSSGKNLLLFKDLKNHSRGNLSTDEIEKLSFSRLSINQLDDKYRFKEDELAFLRQNSIPLREKYDEVFGVKVYQTGKGISSSDPNSKQTPWDKEDNVYLRPKKCDGCNYHFLDGINLDKFLYLWRAGLKDSYINYGTHLAEPRNLDLFNQKKVIIQQIVSPYISAAYVEDPYIVKNTCAVITQKNAQYSLIFLLGLFESKLFMYIHLMQSANAVKKGYPKLNSDDIKRFPLPILKERNQDLVTKLEINIQQLLREGGIYRENLDDLVDYIILNFNIDFSSQYLRLHQAIKQGRRKFEDFFKKNLVDLNDANKFQIIENFYAKFERFHSRVEEISKENDAIVYKLYNIGQDVVKKIENSINSFKN